MFLLLVPTLLSFLILAAHFFRADQMILLFICCAAPWLLAIHRKWAVALVQCLLMLGALEWIRTTLEIRTARMEEGLPWERMAIILFGVAGFTFFSSLVYFLPGLRHRLTGDIHVPE